MMFKIGVLTVLSFVLPSFDAESNFEEEAKNHVKNDYPGQEIQLVFDHLQPLRKLLEENRDLTSYKNLGQGRVQFTAKGMDKPLTAKVNFLVSVPVLNKPLSPHHVIQADDVVLMKVLLSSLKGSYVFRAEELIGKQSRQKVLGVLTPIQTTDIIAPIAVKREGITRILYRTGNLTLITRARALKDGAVGQRIIFETMGNVKKVLEATVVDAHTAEIQTHSF